MSVVGVGVGAAVGVAVVAAVGVAAAVGVVAAIGVVGAVAAVDFAVVGSKIRASLAMANRAPTADSTSKNINAT